MADMNKRWLTLGLVTGGLSGLIAACGSGDGSSASNAGSGGAASSGASTSSQNSGTGGDDFGVGVTGPGAGPGTGTGGGASCAGEKSTAELIPLDLFIMLDSSGSMDEGTGDGNTKWEAVTEALVAFFNDPQSSSI